MTPSPEPRAASTRFILGAGLGALAWIGWFAIAPALGFPDVSPTLLLDHVFDFADSDPAGSSVVGWVVVLGGLAATAAGYLLAVRTGLLPDRAASAIAYGIALWFVVGAVLMPLLGSFVPGPEAAMGAPLSMGMQPTFMMLSEGATAPISGLLAWLVFGAGLALGRTTAESPQHAPTWRNPSRKFAMLGTSITVLLTLGGFAVGGTSSAYEVWVVDQAGSGALYIYDGASLARDPDEATPEVIDLGEAAADVGDGVGDSPHMISFNSEGTHALISNRYSGHVYFMRVTDRKIVASIDVGEEAHDVQPSPDDEMALVSKQADMKIGVIRTDYEEEDFSYDPAHDLDLEPLQGPDFPDNRPRCALFPRDDRITYVTPSGGGLFIVDAKDEPPQIVKSFTRHEVTQSGCGAVVRDGRLFLGWGAADLSRLYAFDPESHSLLHAIPVNHYGPDGHGLTLVGEGRYLWMAIRGSHKLVVVDAEREEIAGALSGFGIVPDMPVVSPEGDYVFLTLRGPAFFEDPSPLVEKTTPGVVIFEVVDEGRAGVPVGFVPLPSRAGIPSDPHAISIVPRTD